MHTQWKDKMERISRSLVAFVFGALMTFNAVLANPTGGEVVAGGAAITNTANTTTINQSSDKAIINWQSFNIGSQEKTQFIQPSSTSMALNRINPNQGASQIFGQLTANGRIILINQSGIYFGPNAYVNVGGIVAST